jgi:putative transposase
MYLYGNGYRNTDQRKYLRQKPRFQIIIDETLIKVSSELIWLWVAIEPIHRQILHIDISFERTMLIAERFIASLINTYGTHSISTDGGTWYPQTCQFLKLDHHIHSFYEKSIIERTIQYIKDGIECFDNYFPCRKKKCKSKHLKQWRYLFIDQYNREILS